MAEKKQDKLLYIETLLSGTGKDQIINCLELGEISPAIADIFIKKINVYRNKSVEIQWTFSENSKG